ncbi:MAG: hypothetical protein KAJ51_15770, partial [Thermoplasmata archaeon]|nr:hypothetical protein [Thermoplasmata archaeon]
MVMANQELAELTTKRNKTFSTGLINGNGFTNGEGTSRALTVRNPSDGLTNGAGTKSALTLHNSNGLVNGNGLTNGNGLSNGNGLTNGNGFTNGNSHLGRSPKQSHIDLIKTRNFKNKIISIIATIILIIAPLYLYTIEISKETEKNILIDGEFNDWQDIAGISDRHNDQNINPNVDIDNFKVKSDHKAGTLSFYLSVHGIMLKGKRVSDSNSDEVQNYAYGLDTVHIFIDIDHSSETGYIFKNIGADYL